MRARVSFLFMRLHKTMVTSPRCEVYYTFRLHSQTPETGSRFVDFVQGRTLCTISLS